MPIDKVYKAVQVKAVQVTDGVGSGVRGTLCRVFLRRILLFGVCVCAREVPRFCEPRIMAHATRGSRFGFECVESVLDFRDYKPKHPRFKASKQFGFCHI